MGRKPKRDDSAATLMRVLGGKRLRDGQAPVGEEKLEETERKIELAVEKLDEMEFQENPYWDRLRRVTRRTTRGLRRRG